VSSVQGPEPTRAGQPGSSRSFIRALAIAALLLIAAFAAAPADAQEVPPGASDPPVVTDPPPPPPVDQQPVDTGAQTPPPAPEPTPAPDPTPAPTPSPDPGSSSEPTPPPSDIGGGTEPDNGQPAHPAGNGSGLTSSTDGVSTSLPASSTSGSDTTLNGSPTKTGYPDSWLGQDTFIVDKPVAGADRSVATTIRGRFAGLILLGATSRAKQMEAKARRTHETAKVSALGAGPPGPGNPLPGQNPFFNLLSGPGGIAANLMLAGMLAVLGAAFVLPRDLLKAFRTPTVTWRPLAYVPPIELPG
jgi:hypothetical protein